MVCICGHNKLNHQSQLDDFGRNEGKCSGLGVGQRCKKGCQNYKKIIIPKEIKSDVQK